MTDWDAQSSSLHTSVEPFVLYPFEFLGVVSPAARPFQQRLVIVQVAGERVGDTLDFIRGTVARLAPEQPFEYRFLDQSLDAPRWRHPQDTHRHRGAALPAALLLRAGLLAEPEQ